jgi:hypothetical protein
MRRRRTGDDGATKTARRFICASEADSTVCV